MILTEQQVRDAIAKVVLNFDSAKLATEAMFQDSGIDSLDHASILLELQERHGLKVPDEAIERCSSVKGIIEFAAGQA
jgi:acyl carrier protein